MKPRELFNLGIPFGVAMKAAQEALRAGAAKRLSHDELRDAISQVVAVPEAHRTHPLFAGLAAALSESAPIEQRLARAEPVAWRQWGEEIDKPSIDQMVAACRLPVAVAGALMPDAHVGYGLPIGGVLATDNAVIPYAVGVDIACRMRLTVLDMPASAIERQPEALSDAIERETRFGVGGTFKKVRSHAVMEEDWTTTPLTRRLRDKAAQQLGTSGSGNHFVEFGTLTLEKPDLGLEAGEYLALLSHSGSRGSGAAVADHYSKLAMALHPDLPPELKRLAWLPLDHEAGVEYWNAMNLMGRYAAANHAVIHRHILKALGAQERLVIENHHNFAWKETHPELNGGRPVIVHRKGATPAGPGVLGVIPGSMASPGFVVRGRGESASLHSASHGAGRTMSRTQARNTFRWPMVRERLAAANVKLLSAGIDEVPFAYKDIHSVMAAQADLVEVVARFDPRLVKMAPEGERAED